MARAGGWAAGALALLLFPGLLLFAGHAITRGLSLWDPVEQAASRFWLDEKPAATLAIYAHMALGGLVTVLAPLQAVPWLRRRHAWIHRIAGRIVVVGALITALGGLAFIASHGTIGGAPMSAGFTLYGVLMALCAIQTYRHARVRSPSHRAWALRLIVLILGSWIYRVHYTLWYMVTDGAYSTPEFTGQFDRIQNVAFYLPYLAILELRLGWERRTAPERQP